MWCQDNNLSLNVSKTKELIVDYRTRGPNTAMYWSGLRVSSSLVSWSKHTNTVVKRTQQQETEKI